MRGRRDAGDLARGSRFDWQLREVLVVPMRQWSEEQKAELSRRMTGRKFSAETISKMRAAKLGKKMSEAAKEKLRLANREASVSKGRLVIRCGFNRQLALPALLAQAGADSFVCICHVKRPHRDDSSEGRFVF